MFFASISKNAVILVVFALVSSGLSALTYWLTKDKIQSEKELALNRLIVDIVPQEHFNNDVYHDCVLVNSDPNIAASKPAKIYRMRQNDKASALIIETTTPKGYSGDITVAVGIFINGTISNVGIIDHKETPGLGDKVEVRKSDWLKQFPGQKLEADRDSYWQVSNDGGAFDAITGATITPRAIIAAIKGSLLYWEQHKDTLFSWPSSCQNQR